MFGSPTSKHPKRSQTSLGSLTSGLRKQLQELTKNVKKVERKINIIEKKQKSQTPLDK